MNHSFDISVAQKYGVNVAIFLNNIAFWIKKNEANKKHFYDGRYWTYNSSEALSELFPYWSVDQMDRLIKKCKSFDLILVDNYNEKAYDRTRWYGLTDKCMNLLNIAIPLNHGSLPAKSRDSSREIAEPIPDIKPDIKPDKRESAEKRAPLSLDFVPDDETRAFLIETAERCEIDRFELWNKFVDLCKTTKKKSADWNAEIRLFLRREKPSSKNRETSNVAPRSTVQEWGPGHPSWDRMYGNA